MEGVSPDPTNKELGVMKAALNVAIMEWEWLDYNTVSKVRMEKASKGRVRYLSDDEFQLILDSCEEWLKPMVFVARNTGMRQGNLLALKWKDINLSQKVIVLEDTKNGDSIGIPINCLLVKVLEQVSRVRHIKSQYVFHDTEGKQVNKMNLHRAFKRACKKAGIEDFRWHDLRHDFASQLVQSGVDLYKVQKLLGHKDSRMTARYAHLAPENLRDAVAVLGKTGGKMVAVEAKKAPSDS